MGGHNDSRSMRRFARTRDQRGIRRRLRGPLTRSSWRAKGSLALALKLALVIPIPAAGDWTFAAISRSDNERLPSRLSYEVTFVESTFGRNEEHRRQIGGLFNETKEHGSLVVETSIRLPGDYTGRSCGEGFDARQNTTVVEQYKRGRRSLISRVLGTHREYVDMALVFGENLVRGDVAGSDERELKLAVSLRTYSEDVRVAMSDFTKGFGDFGTDVADAIEKAVPGLDVASLAFSAFTRSYDTSICAEKYFALQDLTSVRWIVFYNDDLGVLDTAGLYNVDASLEGESRDVAVREALEERLSNVGGYALFAVDVKDYNCRTSRATSQQQCELATQLMKDWLGASKLAQTDRAARWDFRWQVHFSETASPRMKDKGDGSGEGMASLVSRFKLDEHIGNYKRSERTTFPTWTVLGVLWRDTEDGKCAEDVMGELTFNDGAGGELGVEMLSVSSVRYDGSELFTLARSGERVYPSEKATRSYGERCRCLRDRTSLDCAAG